MPHIVYIRVYPYKYICICCYYTTHDIYIYTYIYIYIHMYLYTYIYIYTHVFIYIHIYIYTHIYIYIHIHIYIYNTYFPFVTIFYMHMLVILSNQNISLHATTYHCMQQHVRIPHTLP